MCMSTCPLIAAGIDSSAYLLCSIYNVCIGLGISETIFEGEVKFDIWQCQYMVKWHFRKKLDEPAMRLPLENQSGWLYSTVMSMNVNDTKCWIPCYVMSIVTPESSIGNQSTYMSSVDQFSLAFTSQRVIFNSPLAMQESVFVAIKITRIKVELGELSHVLDWKTSMILFSTRNCGGGIGPRLQTVPMFVPQKADWMMMNSMG